MIYIAGVPCIKLHDCALKYVKYSVEAGKENEKSDIGGRSKK